MSSERPKKPNRNPTFYAENITFALSSPDNVPKLEVKDSKVTVSPDNANLIVDQIDAFAAQIKFHALSRVDIFLYTLIAYYGTGRVVSIGETIGQHGVVEGARGDGTILQAAHSALFPNLIDRLPTELLGQSTKGILSDTPFFDTMNVTVALPQAVNTFDRKLEGRRISAIGEALKLEYPEAARKIINDVSQGLYGPIKGINKFLNVMDKFFSDMERSYIKTSSKTSPSKAKGKTLQYQREGTFSIKGKQFVYRYYVELMLRMNTEEKQRASKSPQARATVYREKYEQIAREILRPRCNLVVFRTAPLYWAVNTYALVWNDGGLDAKMYYYPAGGQRVEISMNAEKLASLVVQLNLRPEKIVWKPWENSHLLIHLLSLENLATITTITGHSFPSTNYNNVARVMREETEADLQEEATPESKRSTYSNADRVPTPPVPALSGDQVEIDVPDDGNCLFWAAAIGLLLPTLQDRTAFNVMYERLFGASGTVVLKSEKKEAKSKIIEINSESTREGVYHILISYDCQKDTPQQFQGQILEKLICEVFRGRVVDKMNEFDLGRQQAIYSDAGRSNWKNYTDHMRLAGSWGGDAEIQAISQLAQRNIAVSDGSTTNRYDFAGATQSLSLIHTNAAGAKGGVKNHYHFHLDKTAYTQHMQNLSGRPNVLAPLSLHVKIETQGKAAYQEGLKFTQKEEYKRAVFQYEEAVKCVPENIEYREALADTQYKLRDFASALENYIAILKYAPEKNIPALLYKLGDTLSHLDRLEEAITKYEEALAINPLDQMGVSKVGLLRAKLSQQAKPSLDDKKQPADEKLDYKKLSSLSDRLYRYIEKSDIADLQGLLLNIKSPQQREALLQGRAKPAESLASPANEAALIALQMPSDAERSKAIAVVKFLVRNGALLDVSLKEQIQKMAIENGFKIGDFSLESKSRFSQYLSRPFAPGVVSRAGYFSQSGAADNTAPLADSSQAVINDKPESLIEINLDDDWGDPNANDAAFN